MNTTLAMGTSCVDGIECEGYSQHMTEDEMRRMIEKMAKEHPEMPRALRLTLRYDAALQKITGRAEEPMFMGEGGAFVYLLQNVFMAYPEMERRYPPGTIGFTI